LGPGFGVGDGEGDGDGPGAGAVGVEPLQRRHARQTATTAIDPIDRPTHTRERAITARPLAPRTMT
jgi:hypothetical protein